MKKVISVLIIILKDWDWNYNNGLLAGWFSLRLIAMYFPFYSHSIHLFISNTYFISSKYCFHSFLFFFTFILYIQSIYQYQTSLTTFYLLLRDYWNPEKTRASNQSRAKDSFSNTGVPQSFIHRFSYNEY